MLLHSLWNGFVFLDLMKWPMPALLFQFRLWHLLLSVYWSCFFVSWRRLELFFSWWKRSHVMLCLGSRNHVGWREDEKSCRYCREVDNRTRFFEIFV
jgi:hypothetical protein